MKEILRSVLKEYSAKQINEGSKRVKLHPRTLSDIEYVSNKIWKDYQKKDDDKPKKGEVMVVDPTGASVSVPVFYLSDLNVQGGVFQLDKNKPRSLYNLFIVVNPEESITPSIKSIQSILYHEVQHLMDLNTTVYLSDKQEKKYGNPSEDDAQYWGHDFEFRAYANEFLQGLVEEYKNLGGKYTKQEIIQSLDSIVSYLSKSGDADEIAQEVLYDINSEMGDRTDFPHSLQVLSLVKRHNPRRWNGFLKMLYSTVEALKEEINTSELDEGYKKPRKWSESYCKKTPCKNMGFSQKASCRPYKNCY